MSEAKKNSVEVIHQLRKITLREGSLNFCYFWLEEEADKINKE